MRSQKNFFEKLFDFSFSSFITPQIAGVVYVLGLVLSSLFTIATIFQAFRFGGFYSLFSIVASAIGLLIYAIVSRILLEGMVAVIRTAENTRILAEEVLSRGSNGSEQN